MLQLDQAIENEFADARVGHTAILRLSELASADTLAGGRGRCTAVLAAIDHDETEA